MDRKLPIGQLNAVWVDPDLVLTVLEDLADASTRGKEDGDLLVACAAAYVEYAGIDAAPGVDALDEADLLTIIALISRVNALSALLASGSIAPGAFDPEALAAAAASARLTDAGDPPVFQLLDFLAHANRAAAEAR